MALTAIMGYLAYTNDRVDSYDALGYFACACISGLIAIILVIIKLL